VTVVEVRREEVEVRSVAYVHPDLPPRPLVTPAALASVEASVDRFDLLGALVDLDRLIGKIAGYDAEVLRDRLRHHVARLDNLILTKSEAHQLAIETTAKPHT
jgi:hypothetical protein